MIVLFTFKCKDCGFYHNSSVKKHCTDSTKRYTVQELEALYNAGNNVHWRDSDPRELEQ